MPYKKADGTVVTTYYLEDGQIVAKNHNQDPRIELALVEFQRLTNGAFNPEGRCAANRAFVEVVARLLSGENFDQIQTPISAAKCQSCGYQLNRDGSCTGCRTEVL